jgi:mRNA-degrading endonuclease YafQ of YafQ-DinJ toxin-antitoxin module
MSLVSASASTPARGTIGVEVKYGFEKDFKKFVSNYTYEHQLNALCKFLASKQTTGTVTVPHSLGGQFVGTFILLNDFHVIYSKEDGTPVVFKITFY